MNIEDPARKLAGVPSRPLLRVVIYYVVLFAAVGTLAHLVPGTLDLINAPLPTSEFIPAGTARPPAAAAVSPWSVVVGGIVALGSACILMLPVTWVYVQTRRKKGFQQSVVQTLIILPLVVAGIILLVQNSTALAFSLGGIVGAVSFRNTLRDTKDTIYIFLAIVIGVASGVHATLVGATISVAFNAVAIIMWWTDFGRVGARLEGAPAERRMRRAKALANRTGGFVSILDRELLRSMTPDQLGALAERARVRQHSAATKAELADDDRRRDWTLRVEVVGGSVQARGVAEPILESIAKRWEYVGTTPSEAGREVLEYRVRIRKKTDRADFIGRFRAAAGAVVHRADLEESGGD